MSHHKHRCHDNSIVLAVLVGLFALPGLAAEAGPQELVNGQPATIHGSTAFTFWLKEPLGLRSWRYRTLAAGTERSVLENPVVEVPPGIRLVTNRLDVRLEEATEHDGRNKYTYKQYVISGEWTATAAEDRAPGECTIRVSFPEVLKARDALEASAPQDAPTVSLFVTTFASAAARAGTAWDHLGSAALCLGIVAVLLALAMASFFSALGGGDFRLLFVGLLLLWLCFHLGVEGVDELGVALEYCWTIGATAGLTTTLLLNLVVYGVVWLLARLGRWTPRREKELWGSILFLVGIMATPWILPDKSRPVAAAARHLPYVAAALLPALVASCIAAARKKSPSGEPGYGGNPSDPAPPGGGAVSSGGP